METKEFFIEGSFKAPDPSSPGNDRGPEGFSGHIFLQKTPGGEKWITPQKADISLHDNKLVQAACFFEWDGKDDTATLRILDPDSFPEEKTLYLFCIDAAEDDSFRKMGLNKADLEKGTRGRCRLLPWGEVMDRL